MAIEEVVLLLVGMRQPLGQFARTLVVDVDHAGHALSSPVPLGTRMDDAGANEIAHRLGSVLIAARLGKLVDFWASSSSIVMVIRCMRASAADIRARMTFL